MTRYKINDEKNLMGERSTDLMLDLILAFFVLGLGIFMHYLLLTRGISHSYSGLDYLFALVAFYFFILFLYGISVFISVAAIQMYRKKWMDWPLYLEIGDRGIGVISVSGNKKVYPHSFFDKVGVEMHLACGQMDPSPKIISYIPFYDFLKRAYGDIEKFIKSKKDCNDHSLLVFLDIYKKSERNKSYSFAFAISVLVDAMGGLSALMSMLEEWHRYYKAHIDSTGIYKEIAKEVKADTSRGARMHFYVLLVTVILSAISFLVLPVHALINATPNTSNYYFWLVSLIIDGFLTGVIVFIGIIKLPKLWRKGWKRNK